MPYSFQAPLDDPLNVYLAALFSNEAYGDLATFGQRISALNTTLAPLGHFERKLQLTSLDDLDPKRLLDTQGIVAADDQSLVVAFRGTEPGKWIDALTDLQALQYQGSGYVGNVHRGFMLAYEGIIDDLERLMKDHAGKKLYLTGHSLGGALATLAAAKLPPKYKIEAVYTFGQPAVGDQAFCDAYAHVGRHFRFINNQGNAYDPVPLVPLQEKLSFGWIARWFKGVESLPAILQETYVHVKRPYYLTEIGKPYGEEGPGLMKVLQLSGASLLTKIATLTLTREEFKAWLRGLGGNHAMATYLAYAKQAAKIPG